jgi:Lrp/AsnC family transcriptional regulator, leucine-responsive regulatory protein
MEFSLDQIDLRILDLMQANARISNAELARDLEMAPSAILERVKKLEQKQVVLGYTTKLNPAALQQKLLAFIFIRTKDGFGETGKTTQALSKIPQVQEVHHIAGEDCFLVKVRTEDASTLMDLMRNSFRKIPNISSTRTTIVLETVKEEQQLVIPKK